MLLKEYLDLNGERAEDFSRAIGVSYRQVYYYVNGHTIPSRRIMERIARATRKKVMPNDFFPELIN